MMHRDELQQSYTPPRPPRERETERDRAGLLDLDLHRVGLEDLLAARDRVDDLAADLGRDLVVHLVPQHLEERVLLLGRQVRLVPVRRAAGGASASSSPLVP